ncbi:MAG: ETC complex I subunit [Parvularculaceae bacterium]|jgi:hypothetical protein|nr:ETC complex I subunit [Parvularculaceae bacterium]
MLARIYQPSKTAMQSGRAKSGAWRLEFEAEAARRIDPLMGWTSAADMRSNQVMLEFETKEAAIAYAERHSIPYQLFESHAPVPVSKAYSDNFAYRRRMPWTH